ncbi:hypothetical protein HHI36_015210 [Cryptolaemus montrouzieri]|uniref:Uncharacterized protein n=1 Tax=Cryptolaemus montrouzieri TaxID=559131 RepID=A0ABD2N512_9CUCU
MNAIKHPPLALKDNNTIGNRIGNLNGVNALGVTLQGPSVPSIAVLHHNGPYNAQQTTDPNAPDLSLKPHSQPSPAASCCIESLPLQPKYLPIYQREYRSEPRELSPCLPNEARKCQRNSLEIPTRYFEETGLTSRIGSDNSFPSIPALAISSSTEVLVSIIESKSRRNSRISVNSKGSNKVKSPDCDFKSPSTEFTNSSIHSTPNENNINCIFNKQDESKYCDTNVDSVIQDFSNSYV